MARYTQDFQYAGSQEQLFNAVYQSLTSLGFQYETFDGENLFRKGSGFWTAPTFVKITFYQGVVRLESWIKSGALVYGEYGNRGFMGFAVKGKMRKGMKAAVAAVQSLGAVPMGEAADCEPDPRTKAPRVAIRPSFCAKCGTPLEPSDAFCMNCGEPITVDSASGTEYLDPNNLPTIREYRKKYMNDTQKMNFRVIVIMCYVLLAINLAAAAINPYILIDCAFYLIPTLIMHIGKSKAGAIALLVVSVVETGYAVVATGTFGGWLWIAAAIYALILFHSVDKDYKALVAGK